MNDPVWSEPVCGKHDAWTGARALLTQDRLSMMEGELVQLLQLHAAGLLSRRTAIEGVCKILGLDSEEELSRISKEPDRA